MSQFENYYGYVKGEAKSFVEEYESDMIDEVENGDTDVNTFINDYRLHEWVDNDFVYVDLRDSADIIEQSDNVETDSGLWEGQEPVDAIKSQAFFTYRTDLGIEVEYLFKVILEEKLIEIESQLDDLAEEQSDEEDESKYDELQEEIDDLETIVEYIDEALNTL